MRHTSDKAVVPVVTQATGIIQPEKEGDSDTSMNCEDVVLREASHNRTILNVPSRRLQAFCARRQEWGLHEFDAQRRRRGRGGSRPGRAPGLVAVCTADPRAAREARHLVGKTPDPLSRLILTQSAIQGGLHT